MSSINWFPGHMNIARKKLAESMEKTDVIIEILDARIPHASLNPLLDQIRAHRQRPALRVLNKLDMADPEVTKLWIAELSTPGNKVVAVSARRPQDIAKLPQLANLLAPHRGTPLKPLRMLIAGIPNVGKSTIMNALLKKRVAAVGDEPAITKTQQRLDLNDRMMLTDTPGLLWPRIDYPQDGLKLAASNTIGRNAYDEYEVAIYLGNLLFGRYAKLLTARYGALPDSCDGISLIEHIAAQRGLRGKGGEYDLEKAAHLLLNDYRNSLIGRITLETPAEIKVQLSTPPQIVPRVDKDTSPAT